MNPPPVPPHASLARRSGGAFFLGFGMFCLGFGMALMLVAMWKDAVCAPHW